MDSLEIFLEGTLPPGFEDAMLSISVDLALAMEALLFTCKEL